VTKQGAPAAIGLTVRPGRAVVVILKGTRRAPEIVLRHESDLVDAWVQDSLHPYHQELGARGPVGEMARRRGCEMATNAAPGATHPNGPSIPGSGVTPVHACDEKPKTCGSSPWEQPCTFTVTFTSQLLTCGVPLPYVSAQLGHADVAVTARHYVRWAVGDFYREPIRLEPGEVPADLFARHARSPHKSRQLQIVRNEEARGTVAIPRASSGSGGAIRVRDPRPGSLRGLARRGPRGTAGRVGWVGLSPPPNSTAQACRRGARAGTRPG
jgi:hypothetical protein